jgi:glucose/mannose-6-phosphate isomerase
LLKINRKQCVDRYYIEQKIFKILENLNFEKIDTQNIHKIYEDWPNIAKKYFEKKIEKIQVGSINHIVFVGMGGSGALGDIFSAILSKTDIHVCVVKGYHLPKTVNENTLVVTISISGNTDETNSVLQDAMKLNCKLIAFSSGGKMEQYCKDKNIEYRKIEKYHSPRASFPSFLFGILNVLSSIIPIEKTDVDETIIELEKMKKQISSKNLSEKNRAISLAKWISNEPLIYYPWGFESVAIRFKNSLQENSKTHVIIEDIVESCHNGIVAWEKKSDVQPIMIKGTDDHIKTKERWKVLSEYFDEKRIEYKEIFSTNGNILTKIICLIYLLDYVSIYKAILEEIDPSPVKSIEYVKTRINEITK